MLLHSPVDGRAFYGNMTQHLVQLYMMTPGNPLRLLFVVTHNPYMAQITANSYLVPESQRLATIMHTNLK